MQNYHEFFYLVLERDCARIYSPSTPFNRLELVQKEVRSCFMDTNLLISEILLLNQTYVSLLFSLNLSIMQYRLLGSGTDTLTLEKKRLHAPGRVQDRSVTLKRYKWIVQTQISSCQCVPGTR
jgi:hypothetical protein